MKRIVILGAGFGGLETATSLSDVLDDSYEITLVDKNNVFFIGFSKIDVLFGRATQDDVSYPYENLRADGIRFIQDTITEIDTDHKTVRTANHELAYDYLVVALGADLDPDAVPGFVESGGHEFYSMAGVKALAEVLRDFTEGRLILGIFKPPYKCPPAPYEVACQLSDFYEERGVRDAITMKMVIPTPRAVGNPNVSLVLEAQLVERDIELLKEWPIQSIDANAKQVRTRNGPIDYDLFIGVPVHVPPAVVAASTLSDGGFVAVDTETLETEIPNVYAVGDVTSISVGDKAVPKAGAFAEDAARTVVSDILRKEGRTEQLVPFKARGGCYAEFGKDAVAKIEADFLGGDEPMMTVSGPSEDFRSDKEHFATSRRDRWFRSST